MPVAVQTATSEAIADPVGAIKSALASTDLSANSSSALRLFSNFDSTPSIGTEFRAYSPDGKPVLSIRQVLEDETKLRALGRLVSERGVVFFRDAVLSPEDQKVLVHKLGLHGGKPESSTLHIHPLTLEGSELGDEISVISNDFVFDPKVKRDDHKNLNRIQGNKAWHSDITFENHPSDYASLQIRDLPSLGGDTIWASAYEAYDRLSPAYRAFLEPLTATHTGQNFIDQARKAGVTFREHRGSPANVGQHLSTVHPVIRTNPVTGWKGLFVNSGFTKRINELTPAESEYTLRYLFDHISANHDLQVRFRWEANSLAIWDNRSTFHAATYDVEEGDKRTGTRSVSIGERPYFDPQSVSRREGLAANK
ncbi:hypothetical protein P7C73_g2241, partial [Tremellales sp. Uapishka_1]